MRFATLSGLACALALSACALKDLPPHEDIVQAGAPNLKPPAHWAASGATPGTFATDNWLASWNDPGLDALLAEALAYNTDLRAAVSRVDLAAAYLQAAGSPIWPQVNLVARGGGKMGGDATGLQGVGVFASWELDVWGRVRDERAASAMQYESAQLDAEYARQSIAALVAKGWVLAIESRLAKARAEEMLQTAERLASLTRDRQRVGVGDDYDVALADANIETFRDTVRSLDLAYQNALRALETLVGRYPAAAVTVADSLPRWPGDLPAGLPSELLERRPDVVAAERRVAAAFYRTEESKAARLPRISLVASFTTLSSEMFVLQNRENPVLSAGAGLVQPLFLGGYLQSQVDARTAEQQAAIADYGKVSAKVFGEVEGALSAGFAAGEREAILERAVEDNKRALALANVRYRVGSGDLRAVQQQQMALYSVEVSLLRVQTDRLVQRVNLHLALGGSFASPVSAATKTGDASPVVR
jgi:NodT family efflux transporter outer membrane factor (OMF) lipoprotein